jgi:hypothetical protein
VDVIDNYELFSILGFVSFHAPLLLVCCAGSDYSV